MRHFIKTLLSVIVLVAVSASPSFAGKEEAGKFVDTLAKDVLAMISDKTISKTQKQEKLQAMFKSHVDIDWIGKFVLGKYWRTATDAQKAAYLKSYEKFLLLNYTSNFENFGDAGYQVIKTETGVQPGEYVVGMLLKRPGQEDIRVDYRLREMGKKDFRVIDIIAEGISMLTSQRSEFSSVISRSGMDSLITQLASKTATTSKP